MSLLCQSYTQVYGARHAWAYTPAVAADAEPTGLVRDFSGVPGRHGYVMTSVPASQPASAIGYATLSLVFLQWPNACMHATDFRLMICLRSPAKRAWRGKC
jgi:hypothetical protein